MPRADFLSDVPETVAFCTDCAAELAAGGVRLTLLDGSVAIWLCADCAAELATSIVEAAAEA